MNFSISSFLPASAPVPALKVAQLPEPLKLMLRPSRLVLPWIAYRCDHFGNQPVDVQSLSFAVTPSLL